jgi:hypothetical protein
MLAVIAHQADAAHARIFSAELLDDLPGIIRAAVVDENNFVIGGGRAKD